MSKKKKYKDFWGTTAEDQLEELERFDAMEEKGDIDIFSLGKIPKHYTGLEPEITADINKVFGNKVVEGVTYEVPEDAFNLNMKESEDFVASLKDDKSEGGADEIHFDESMVITPVKNENSAKKEEKVSEVKDTNKVLSDKNRSHILPIRFSFYNRILELDDNVVSLFYKVANGEDRIRYLREDITYDDSVIREIVYLVRNIIAYRYPTALYTTEEFDTMFDEVKGTFIDSDRESRYMFIDFDDYVAAYYFGEDNFIKQLDNLKVARSNEEFGDIIMGLAIESLDFNLAFTREDFKKFYESKQNGYNKKDLIDIIKMDINPGDNILFIDTHSFKSLSEKSGAIIDKYIRGEATEIVLPTDTDTDLEDEINKLLNSIDDEDEDDDDDLELPDEDDDEDDNDIEYDPEMDDDEEDDTDDEDGEDDADIDNDTDDNSDDTEDIDTMIDNAISEDEEPESKPIDKVAVNNNKQDQSMVVPVTRKSHP